MELYDVVDSSIVDNEVNIMFVGDVHLNYLTPKSRIDDYPTVCLDKLSKVLNLASQKNCNAVVFLGDLFHKPNQPLDFLLKVISKFNEFRQKDIDVFTIVGNHDIRYNRLDTLSGSALGILFEADVIYPLNLLSFEHNGHRITIAGRHFPDDFQNTLELFTGENEDLMGDLNVSVLHKFYEYGLSKEADNFHKDDVINGGFDIYVMGHDHVSYDDIEVSGRRVIRPGSLTRATSHKYQINKEVNVKILSFNFDTLEAVIKTELIDVKPAELVFSSQVLEKGDLKQLNKDLSANFTSLLTMLEKPRESKISVYEILDNTNLDKRVKERIESYLYASGIVRQ